MRKSYSQTFPCLEFALRVRIGHQFIGRVDRKGKPRPPVMLPELLEAAKAQGLISGEIEWAPLATITAMIAELFDPRPIH